MAELTDVLHPSDEFLTDCQPGGKKHRRKLPEVDAEQTYDIEVESH